MPTGVNLGRRMLVRRAGPFINPSRPLGAWLQGNVLAGEAVLQVGGGRRSGGSPLGGEAKPRNLSASVSYPWRYPMSAYS